jgi:diacylglycerol kinase (ATP)
MTAEPPLMSGRTGGDGRTSRHFRVLVNPVSGGGSAPAAVARVERLLTEAGARVVVVPSTSAEHSRASAVEAIARGEVVVAAGGDGMLASIAGTVVEHGGTLGIVPSGRGNDFARMLRIDGDPEKLAHHLLEGDPTPVDVIETRPVTGGPATVVLGSMYAGVDSLASEIVDRSRRLPSAVQYPYAAVRALLTYRPACFTVTVDGETLEQDAYAVVVANSGYYGKGMHIAPAADVHDGLLDVVVLPAGSRLGMVRRLPKVYDGSHADLPEVTVLRGRTVEVASATDVPAYGDGERLGPLPRTATVLPGALSVLLA